MAVTSQETSQVKKPWQSGCMEAVVSKGCEDNNSLVSGWWKEWLQNKTRDSESYTTSSRSLQTTNVIQFTPRPCSAELVIMIQGRAEKRKEAHSALRLRQQAVLE